MHREPEQAIAATQQLCDSVNVGKNYKWGDIQGRMWQ